MMAVFKFISRCLELAERGRGKVGINPMVGAVLLREGRIIGEAWHEAFGGLHAERKLITKLDHTSMPLSVTSPDDVLYVNLEPCSHHGKTPPCTDIIIESGMKRVVFGMFDPNPAVRGRGVEALRAAGVDVTGPVDSVRCRRFNRGFVSLHEKGRPWITVKRAQTKDGRVAKADKSALKITSKEQDAWSHQFLRARHDALLVGVETVIRDDPLLTVRNKNKKVDQYQPLRIVLDPEMRMPSTAWVVTGDMASGTCVVTVPDADTHILESRGVHVFRVPLHGDHFVWNDLWSALTMPSDGFHGITSILVEGGPRTWRAFQEAGMVDEEVILLGA